MVWLYAKFWIIHEKSKFLTSGLVGRSGANDRVFVQLDIFAIFEEACP